MIGLAQRLGNSIEQHFVGISGDELATRAARISEGYRASRPSGTIIADTIDAAIYALMRLPATAAAVEAVLAALAERAPGYAPKSVLDIGAGPGTASLIAAEHWPDAALTLCDNHPQFLTLAQRLLAETGTIARFAATDLERIGVSEDAAELVIASYALTEFGDGAYRRVAEHLWNLTAGLLVVVEPGRPRDYRRLMELRSWAIGQGARVAAPCPHQTDCPLAGEDWCHFSVRLPRSRAHKRLKSAALGYEDEKFSYLILARPAVALTPPLPRVLAPPEVKKHETRLKLCEADGQEAWRGILKRSPQFSQNRRVKWGDTVIGLDAPFTGQT